MEKQEIQEVLERIKAAWPSFKCEDATARVWCEKLKFYQIADVHDTINLLMDTEKFPPTLADIFGTLQKLNRFKPRINKMSREERTDHHNDMLRRGIVLVHYDDGGCGWEHKSYCVFNPRHSRWERKIEFVLEHLGAESVTRILKEIVGDPIAVKWADLVGSKDWLPRYKQTLDGMVNDVLKTIGARP